jgi:hypothetical protein
MGNVVVGRLRASVDANKSRVATAYQQSGWLQSTLVLARQHRYQLPFALITNRLPIATHWAY